MNKIIFSVVILTLFTGTAAAFSFSEYEKKDRSSSSSLSAVQENCLTDKKIATVIGEKHLGVGNQSRRGFGSIVNELNGYFRKYGLKTFSEAELTKQIADAEQEAFLNNDLDAAISAADRLGADLFLRGVISSKVQKNTIVGVDEVFITLSLSFVDSLGAVRASSEISNAVFSDADTTATVFRLVKKNADQIISDLIRQYCSHENN